MRYLYLFFLLLCHWNTSKAADVQPIIIAENLTTTETYCPIEPVIGKKQTKKQQKLLKIAKKQNTASFIEIGVLIILLIALPIILGLIAAAIGLVVALPFGWFYAIPWLWITGAVVQIGLIILWTWKAIENWKNHLWATKYNYRERGYTPYQNLILDLLGITSILCLDAISLLILGILFNINWLWISAIVATVGFLILIIHLFDFV